MGWDVAIRRRSPGPCGWATLIVLGAFAGWASAVSLAAASDSEPSAVQQVSYSTGKSGGKLKWLPQQADSAVVAAQHTAPADSPRSSASAQSQKRSVSPSGDLLAERRNVPSPAPVQKVEGDLLSQTQLEPKPNSVLPGMSPNGSAVPNSPYLLPEIPAPSRQGAPAKGNSKQLLEQEIVSREHEFKERCPSPKDLKPIDELTTNTKPPDGDIPRDCPLGNATFQPRAFAPMTYAWTASGLCHKPLYFEDVQLERYGHMAGPWVQPFASAAHFFLTVPILPYKMGLETPHECLYTLGYYRPGDCAPYLFDPLPLSVRGALFEAGAWVGGVFAFP